MIDFNLMFDEHLAVSPHWIPEDPRGIFLSTALAGEVGELANIFNKQWRDGQTEERRKQALGELADVGAYAFMLARHLGTNLQNLVADKMREVERRPEYQELVRKHNERLLKELI